MKAHPVKNLSAFTLLEVLVSVTVLALMMTIMAELITRTQDTVSTASKNVTEFQEARRALESLSSTLSQTTMDAVWSYRREAANQSNITGYDRASDHHFILAPSTDLLPASANPGPGQAVFFQAPMGITHDTEYQQLHHLLNCCGFYVQYGSDLTARPTFMANATALTINPERKRFRLMQYRQPAENSILYTGTDLGLNRLTLRTQALRWFQQDLATTSRPLADNVLALILIPHALQVTTNATTGVSNTTATPDSSYRYDSRDFQWNGLNDTNKTRRHQLPTMVTVTLVAADERSYEALSTKLGEAAASTAIQQVFAEKFKNHANYETDMAAVEAALTNLSLHYKVLTTSVSMRSSKWISENEM